MFVIFRRKLKEGRSLPIRNKILLDEAQSSSSYLYHVDVQSRGKRTKTHSNVLTLCHLVV